MKKITFALLLLLISSPAFALKPGDEAPMFTLQDIAGRNFQLSDVVGARIKGQGKGIVVSFFASWCASCREELPLINSLVDELKAQGITVALIGLKENAGSIKALLAQLKVDKPIILTDPSGKTGQQYGVRFLPVTFFIGPEGRVKDIIYGEISDQKEMRNSVQKLLQK